ncbi:hypothetical protein K6119_04340 [Paracrocinitomix mangrovi]|uniref:hypothetical protein n=1 Tax=Paracrocinitomix mangrovi TaxID=2862509 RepID=UPI001C8E557B|nr:hypothetical protein [Paracrocinitomix mangrovi]UKN02743.1 hypothetical protein K6119_04340 [Paracrocinitomix mangrovi]
MKSFTTLSLILLSCSCGNPEQNETDYQQEEINLDTTTQVGNEIIRPNYPNNLNSIWDSVEFIADWFKHDAKDSKTLENVPNDFTSFYDEFISDSSYQKKSIDFTGFLGVIGECDSTIRLHNSNWDYDKWDFRDFFNQEEGWDDRIYVKKNVFYYEFDLIEIGIIYRRGFLKIDGVWKMVFEEVNTC